MQHFIIIKRIACSLCGIFVLSCFNTAVLANSLSLNNVDTDNQYVLEVSVFTHAKNTNTQTFSYLNKERVNKIIMDAAAWARSQNESTYQYASDNIYWPAAGLFYTNNDKTDNQLSSLLEQLTLSQVAKDIPVKNAITNIKSFLTDSLFKERINIPIEPDYHDANGKINPNLSGDYQLYLPPKSLHIWIVGAVENSAILPFLAMTDATDYLKEVTRIHDVGQSHVWIISPDGQSHKQGIAYWNKEDTFVLPGSIIFVPFKDLSDQLNNAIADLLKQRVMSP